MKSMITICVSSSHQSEHQWFGSFYRYLGIHNKRQTSTYENQPERFLFVQTFCFLEIEQLSNILEM